MPHRILVTGASIAGTTAAYWLARYGCSVTLMEKSKAFRNGGQNIDVRGAGRTVLREMGLEATARGAGTGETGTDWIDESGRPIVAFVTDDLGGGGITAELEILRRDLARLRFDAAKAKVSIAYSVTASRRSSRPLPMSK